VTGDDYFLTRLRAAASDASAQAPDVSAWSVGMHVHHCSLAMEMVCGALVESGDEPPPDRLNLIGTVVLLMGRIPRGRGRAPAGSVPPPDLPEADLLAGLQEAEARLRRASELPDRAWFRHFAFGVLNRNQALRFVRVHNRHHLRIVRDIRKAAGRG
jgi:hypothetical protein